MSRIWKSLTLGWENFILEQTRVHFLTIELAKEIVRKARDFKAFLIHVGRVVYHWQLTLKSGHSFWQFSWVVKAGDTQNKVIDGLQFQLATYYSPSVELYSVNTSSWSQLECDWNDLTFGKTKQGDTREKQMEEKVESRSQRQRCGTDRVTLSKGEFHFYSLYLVFFEKTLHRNQLLWHLKSISFHSLTFFGKSDHTMHFFRCSVISLRSLHILVC